MITISCGLWIAKIVVKGTYANIKVRLLRQSTNNESFIIAEKVAGK